MKKIIFILIIIFNFNIGKAQVGINTTNPQSTLHIEGSLQTKYNIFNTSQTIADESYINEVTNASSVVTLTLPKLSTATAGRRYVMKNANLKGTYNVIVKAPENKGINFLGNLATTITLKPGEVIDLVRTTETNTGAWSIEESTLLGDNQNIYNSDGNIEEPRQVLLKNNNSLIFNSEATSGNNQFVIGNSTTDQIFGVNVINKRVLIGPTTLATTPDATLDVRGNIKVTGLENSTNVSDKPLVIDPTGFIKISNDLSELGGNIYNIDGTLTGSRTVNLDNKTLKFNSTAKSGTSQFTVDGTTLNVNTVDKRVGIGTATPSAKLEVNGNVILKGLSQSLNANNSPLVVDSNGEIKKSSAEIGTYFLGGSVYVKLGESTGGGLANNLLIGEAENVTYTIGGATTTSKKGGINSIIGNGYKISNPSNGIFDIVFDDDYEDIYGMSVNIIDAYPSSGTNPNPNIAGTRLRTLDNAQISFISNTKVRIKTGDDSGNLSNRSFTFLITGR